MKVEHGTESTILSQCLRMFWCMLNLTGYSCEDVVHHDRLYQYEGDRAAVRICGAS